MRRRDIFVTQTQIERQARQRAPVVLSVKVGFIDPVLKEEWTIPFLESTDAAIEQCIEAGRVVDAIAIVAETPKTAREIVCQIVKSLAADRKSTRLNSSHMSIS